MVFSSTIFLFSFLPTTLIGYYLLGKKFRNFFLLLMSLLFYAVGEPKFVFVMMASIAINFVLGIALEKNSNSLNYRRFILFLALLANLGLLFYYKYFDFTVVNLNTLFNTHIALRYIVLPIGISFFTFQGMSYIFDIYMGKAEVQKNPLHVALYIALFPQLIAGPIVRYTDINREITERKETLSDFASGIERFTIGLAKKVILANSFAQLADMAFNTPANKLGMGLAWLGAIAYTLQIYFDFSGYSDMAIGLGRMFGFHFRENFNYPYIACSVQDFWRRWHISLSTWFRDYVYIPMGGNRSGNVYIHLFVVFFLTGLWHGASWNFIVWGLWHGLFLMMERIFRKRELLRIPIPIKWLYTILIVIVGWVFFRAANITAALAYLKSMAGTVTVHDFNALYTWQDYRVTFLLGIICMLPLAEKYGKWKKASDFWKNFSYLLEPVGCGLLLLIGIAYTVASTYNPFIYFNF